MRGHVRKRGKSWAVVYDEQAENGRRHQRWKGGFATKKAAETFLTDALGKLGRGEYVEPATVTVGDYLAGWLPTIEATIRPSTLASYRMITEKQLTPRIGKAPLQRLTAAQLDSMYAELLRSGRRDGKGGLSPRTVRYVHAVLHRALEKAVRQRLIVRNPADDAEPPAKAKTQISTWAPEQLGCFLEHVHEDRLYAAYVLAVTTGLRRGEVLGLPWDALDLECGKLRVRRTLVLINYQPTVSTPKTDRGRRVVELDSHTLAALKEHRKRQLAERLAAGELWQSPLALVFTDELGGPMHPQAFSDAFQRHAKAAGLPRIRLHELRHSHATALLRAGEHPAIVSRRLGHYSAAFTIDTYTDSVPEIESAAAERAALLIFGGKEALSV